MSREHIIGLVVLVAMLGSVGAGYQFYYKERLEGYAQNVTKLENLEKAYTELKDTFEGHEPRVYISAVKAEIQPLAEEVLHRAAFFNMGGSLRIDAIPEGRMLKFYYEEEFKRVFRELREEAQARNPWFTYPNTTFGAPRPEDFSGRSVNKAEVSRGLRKIHFGCSLIRTLLEAKAWNVTRLEVWPPRKAYGDLLDMRTVGLAFAMSTKDLVEFLDSLRLEGRYFRVDAISIQSRYLRWPTEPPLEVQMLLTQAAFAAPEARLPGAAAPATAAGPSAGPDGAEAMSIEDRMKRVGFERSERQPRRPPLTRLQKMLRWLDKYFWPF